MKLTLIFAVVAAATATQADPIRNYWFNGAEISSYELSQPRYGANHPGHAELIFVTEPFLTDKQVKNERGGEPSTSVLKLNAFTTFNTGLYSYRTMTSTFQPIDLETFPVALKSTTSIQDWCGQVFHQANLKPEGWQIQIRSYFETPADIDLELRPVLLEEGIWLLLRLDPAKLPTGEFEMIPSALFDRYHHRRPDVAAAEGTLESEGEESTYTLKYPSLGRELTIRFETAFPHGITGWTEKVGDTTTTATLKGRVTHSDYWNQGQPEDAEKRKTLGLDPVAN